MTRTARSAVKVMGVARPFQSTKGGINYPAGADHLGLNMRPVEETGVAHDAANG